MTVEDIKRIIAYKKARLESLVQPDMWIRYTKNMESGEIKEFKQSCIDDEIIIEALEKQIPTKPTSYEKHYFKCPSCLKDLGIDEDGLYVYQEIPPKHCPECGQALDWSDSE